MNFELTEQQKQIQSAARHFVDELLIPLEPELLRNEREGRPGIELRQIRELQQKAKTQGLWGIETPEEYGGANLGTVTSALLKMELGRTCIPFVFGGKRTIFCTFATRHSKASICFPLLRVRNSPVLQ